MSAPNNTELVNCTPLSAPAAETVEEVGSEEEDEKPVLPPELLFEIMKLVHRLWLESPYQEQRVWKRTLLCFVRVSRVCHALGMRLVVRDLFIRQWDTPSRLRQFEAFLEDGLQIDKFSAVQRFWPDIADQETFRLSSKLIRKVGANLQELKISLSEFPISDDPWKDYQTLHGLKKLTICCPYAAIKNPEVATTHTPYHGLLQIAEDNWDHLEDFRLDFVRPQLLSGAEPYQSFDAWQRELDNFPTLRGKLVYVAVLDSSIEKWATFDLPNIKEVCLHCLHCLHTSVVGRDQYRHWRAIDAFPGLTKLELFDGETHELLDWPFRSLKKLEISCAELTLSESEYSIARKRVEDQQLNLTLRIHDIQFTSEETESAWIAEAKFWKTVKGVKVVDLEGREWSKPRLRWDEE